MVTPSKVPDFQRYLLGTASASTAKVYGIAAEKLEKFITERGWTVDALPPVALVEFVEQLAARHRPATVAVYLNGAEEYLGFLRLTGHTVPAIERAVPPRQNRAPVGPSEAQLRLVAVNADRADEPYRTCLLIMSACPVRPAELVRLTAHDLVVEPPRRRGDPAAMWFLVRPARTTQRIRRVPVVPRAAAILRAYLRTIRPRLGSSAWVFPAPRSAANHISSETLIRHLQAMASSDFPVQVNASELYAGALKTLAQAGVAGYELAEIRGAHTVDAVRPYATYDPEAVYRTAARAECAWLKGLA